MSYYLENIRHKIAREVAKKLNVSKDLVVIETANEKIGSDLAIPCFKFARTLGKSPQDIAEQLVEVIDIDDAAKLGAIAGFVNIWLDPELLARGVFQSMEALAPGTYGNTLDNKGEIAVAEYTDPNPFKMFHIGHAYQNAVGDSLSRLYEASGAEVHRVSYHGDVGLHIAKATWGIIKQLEAHDWKMGDVPEAERPEFLGKSYAYGASAYKNNEVAKKEIEELNKEIYNKSSKELTQIYETGRQWSLDYFEQMYEKLGAGFEKSYYESETVDIARKVVEEGLKKGVFEKSDGAIVFRGEPFGLHTRVFINSQGIPTYEAKDLGLAHLKHGDYQYAISIIITASEQEEYFKVLLKALEILRPELADATVHLSTGMVRIPGGDGKMSSRTGKVITADQLIDTVEREITNKAPDSPSIKENTLAAIKYTFLKQSIGGNIVFDIEQSVSLEGNSGPYIQYAAVRVRSIIDKSKDKDTTTRGSYDYEAEKEIIFLMARYPDYVKNAVNDLAPHDIAQFAFELAKAWNRYYEMIRILDEKDNDIRAARLNMLKYLYQVFEHSLHLLGITIPRKM